MRFSRFAYKIEGIVNNGVTTTLTVKEFPDGKELHIGFNNLTPFPFDIDSYSPVIVVCKIKSDDVATFTDLRLYPSGGTVPSNIVVNDLMDIFRNDVFPLMIGDILIIEKPSLYEAIEQTQKQDTTLTMQ